VVPCPMRFSFLIWTMLGAASLASSAGCGSKVEVNGSYASGGAAGHAGGGAGGGTTGGAAATGGNAQSSSTGVSGGVTCGDGVPVADVFLGDEPCACDGSGGVQVETECGLSVLDAPYRTDMVLCDVQDAHAVAYECKGTHLSLTVLACADPLMSPCLSISVSQSPDGASSSGLWIDGNGDQWKLSDVQMPGALPWSGPSAKGAFVATATRGDGATQEIKGEYNVCIATTITCPI
jgi:hypothetical protein